MTEHLTQTPEARLPAPESEPLLEAHNPSPEDRDHHEAAAEQQAEAARSVIEQTAESANPVAEKIAAETPAPATPTHVNRELKAITLRRELQHIRRQLPAPERTLSKVIHQPVVRAASEVVGNSLSRPSGLLGGGLVAFIGSVGYLFLAKHIGFSYNYVVFFLLFIIGFALGLFLELVVWAATSSRRHAAD